MQAARPHNLILHVSPSSVCLQRNKEVQFYIEVPAVTSVGKVAVQAASMHNMFRHIQR
jgi:hypothetical protein